MAKYAADGAHVTLVTCTLGEQGEVLVPALAGIAAERGDQLGGWRMHELDEACRVLGVADHRFLGGAGRYRDSGMMDTPANENPTCFWRADLDEAAGYLVEIIREVKPQVVITYDDFGGYGHPDHIQAHRVTVRAVEQTRDIVKKFYYTAVPRSFIAQSIKAMKEQGHEFFGGAESADDVPFAQDDEVITTQVDARDYLDAKVAAMRAHATQIEVDGPFFALSNHIGQRAFGLEHFVLVEGKRGPAGQVVTDLADVVPSDVGHSDVGHASSEQATVDPRESWESDLFAGL
jgi:N-acetyl-1-D-myo-inositol-2-amino-2-deoxy-alpha-D-glucopyranoside deacetylase